MRFNFTGVLSLCRRTPHIRTLVIRVGLALRVNFVLM